MSWIWRCWQVHSVKNRTGMTRCFQEWRSNGLCRIVWIWKIRSNSKLGLWDRSKNRKLRKGVSLSKGLDLKTLGNRVSRRRLIQLLLWWTTSTRTNLTVSQSKQNLNHSCNFSIKPCQHVFKRCNQKMSQVACQLYCSNETTVETRCVRIWLKR